MGDVLALTRLASQSSGVHFEVNQTRSAIQVLGGCKGDKIVAHIPVKPADLKLWTETVERIAESLQIVSAARLVAGRIASY
ncbi:MAG: hypothetical protein ACRENP_10540 [Longimicrobiales bacterium]